VFAWKGRKALSVRIKITSQIARRTSLAIPEGCIAPIATPRMQVKRMGMKAKGAASSEYVVCKVGHSQNCRKVIKKVSPGSSRED